MLRVFFMSLNLMLSKYSLLFVFVKPKLYCFNHSYALQVSFFSLITHVVVTSTFGCVRNFVLIKLHLPMFLKVNWPLPQTVARAICMQKCPGLLLNAHRPDAQRNAWRLRFFQHCARKSAVFGRVFLNNLQYIRPLMKLTTCLWFFKFLFQW